ncbi:hypothetical protein H8E77_24250 [bacterium]|nr:hypothetical protein [bacterium]
MSYFMIAIGAKPNFDHIPKAEALPVEEAQDYVKNLFTDMVSQDESDVWFIHDGDTGTSHDFVVEAEEHIRRTGQLASTRLESIINACEAAGDSFRIWWAGEPRAHLDVKSCITIDNTKQLILEQVNHGGEIAVTYCPK